MTIIKNVGNTCAYKFQHISETWKFYSHFWTKTLFERKVIIGVYQIRWSERESDVSYKPFYLALPFFVEVFEVINGAHKFEEISTKGWGTKSKVEATQFLNPLTKFEFVIGIIALCRRLHSVAGITRHLQLMLLMHTKIAKSCQETNSSRQCAANSHEEYYKGTLVIPILDSFISEMTHLSHKFNCKAAKWLVLTISVLF